MIIDERKKLDLIKALKVKKVLLNRSDRDYYTTLIEKSQTHINIMGVTASRFLKDFADTKNTAASGKVLLTALNRNVSVKILIPSRENLSTESEKQIFDASQSIFLNLKNSYPNQFSVRYFNHPPAHSIFEVDDEAIIGPVIPNLSSKDTPGIHMLSSSKYAETYLNYFKEEWKNGHE
jgi:hypothetical protein